VGRCGSEATQARCARVSGWVDGRLCAAERAAAKSLACRTGRRVSTMQDVHPSTLTTQPSPAQHNPPTCTMSICSASSLPSIHWKMRALPSPSHVPELSRILRAFIWLNSCSRQQGKQVLREGLIQARASPAVGMHLVSRRLGEQLLLSESSLRGQHHASVPFSWQWRRQCQPLDATLSNVVTASSACLPCKGLKGSLQGRLAIQPAWCLPA